jgi:hypothetical protein
VNTHERRAVHRAFAGVLAGTDRQAWHLAAAAEGPDDADAAGLERAGERAERAGGYAAAAARIATALAPPGEAGRDRHERRRQIRRVAVDPGGPRSTYG